MSSFAYGKMVASQVGVSANGHGEAPASGRAKVVDTLAAIVPAEALLFYTGILLPEVTSSTETEGERVLTVTDPDLFQWGLVASLVIAAVLYILGRIKAGAALEARDAWHLLIPVCAMACWAALQEPNAVTLWLPEVAESTLRVGAAAVGIVLGFGAFVLDRNQS